MASELAEQSDNGSVNDRKRKFDTTKELIEDLETQLNEVQSTIEAAKKKQRDLILLLEIDRDYIECDKFDVFYSCTSGGQYASFVLPSLQRGSYCTSYDNISHTLFVNISDKIYSVLNSTNKKFTGKIFAQPQSSLFLRRDSENVYICLWNGEQGVRAKLGKIETMPLKLIEHIGLN